jgi:uncharacterized protein YegL
MIDDLIPNRNTETSGGIKYSYKDKCPVVLLLDCSGSMSSVINDLKMGVEKLKKYTISDDVAKKSVEILVVTFDSTARKLDDFKLSEDWKVPALNATGSTAMGEAIKIGLESLQQRKIHLRNNGVNFYKPWLVLITDGAPTDMQKGDSLWKQIQGELKKSSDRICLPWAFGTETADMGNLKDLFPDGHVFRLKDANFESIFKWLSDSVNLVSRSSPGEKIKAPNPGNYQSISLEI